MIGRRQGHQTNAALFVLAAALFACIASASAIDGIVSKEDSRLTWSPNRDDAPLVDNASSVQQTSGEIEETAFARSPRLAQRPRSLSRPAPWDGRTYLTDAAPGESLPSITGTPMSPEGLPVPPGGYYNEGDPSGMNWRANRPGFNSCCDPCCDPCNAGCGRWGLTPICIPLPRPPLDNLELFGGVQGFTGPVNRGGSGSFGFHEGFNWGMPCCSLLAMQWGALWTQSNFDGNYLTPDQRNQVFVTGGAFRRVDWGFQGGVVVDCFHDDWDYKADLTQLRAELSWLDGCRNELGFWCSIGLNNAENLLIRQSTFDAAGVRFASTQSTIEVNNIYAFFYRRQFCNCGQGRFFGGFTGERQGLVGADLLLPINPHWSARSAFIYVIPQDNSTATDPRFQQESWNVSITMVYSWCPRPPCRPNYCRPLFNVADNGSFITRLLRQ